VEWVGDSDIVDCDGHFATLMEIEGAVTEFRDYGLQCLLPQPIERERVLDDLISTKAAPSEFVASGCCQFANFKTMHKVLGHVIGRWLGDRDAEWMELLNVMVADEELTDWDNNSKVLLMAMTTTMFSELKMVDTEYLRFVRECIAADTVSLSVLDQWRMDEFDRVTKGKKAALMVLTDLIHDLQNKEIRDSEQPLTTDEEPEDAALWSYIGSDERSMAAFGASSLSMNGNRAAVHRCPWKKRPVPVQCAFY